MKTVYSAILDPSIVSKWIDMVVESFSCACEVAVEDTKKAHQKYQTSGYQSVIISGETVKWLDEWNAEVSLLENDGAIELIGVTTGGNLQAIRLQENGQIIVTHEGRRGSTLGRIWDFVRGVMEDHAWSKDWRLDEYHSSQDEWWPVSCWVPAPPWEERLRPVAKWEAVEKGWLDNHPDEEIFLEKGNSGRQIVW